MSEKRYAVKCTYKAPPIVSYLKDGDQDGDRWEGPEDKAHDKARRLNLYGKPGWSYEVEQVSGPTGCNKHTDCQLADQEAESTGKLKPYHCHSDDCEECFGC